MEAYGNESPILVVLSQDPEARWDLSEGRAIDWTEWVHPSTGLPDAASASQVPMVQSSDPETICCPSGEEATDDIK